MDACPWSERRHVTKSPRGKASKRAILSVPVDPMESMVAKQPQAEPNPTHLRQNLGSAARASRACQSAGVSPHSFTEAWADWVQHMSPALGRQLELGERAQHNTLLLLAHLAGTKSDASDFIPPDRAWPGRQTRWPSIGNRLLLFVSTRTGVLRRFSIPMPRFGVVP